LAATVNIQIKLKYILIRYNCSESNVSGSKKVSHSHSKNKTRNNTTKSEIHFLNYVTCLGNSLKRFWNCNLPLARSAAEAMTSLNNQIFDDVVEYLTAWILLYLSSRRFLPTFYSSPTFVDNFRTASSTNRLTVFCRIGEAPLPLANMLHSCQ
jgi:thiaminase